MPYATFGLALGRDGHHPHRRRHAGRDAAVAAGRCRARRQSRSNENLNNQFGYGYAAGLGVDFCLMANLFVRAEYEYVQFVDFHGLNAHMHNVRVGAALQVLVIKDSEYRRRGLRPAPFALDLHTSLS